MLKEDVNTLTTWVHLHLEFKYWGEGCLNKIVGQVGKVVKCDQATIKREKLQYACVMLEFQVDKEFPEEISFINEKQQLTRVKVEYEWKHVICQQCKVVGHTTGSVRRM